MASERLPIPPDLLAEMARFIEDQGWGELVLQVQNHQVTLLRVNRTVKPQREAYTFSNTISDTLSTDS